MKVPGLAATYPRRCTELESKGGVGDTFKHTDGEMCSSHHFGLSKSIPVAFPLCGEKQRMGGRRKEDGSMDEWIKKMWDTIQPQKESYLTASNNMNVLDYIC